MTYAATTNSWLEPRSHTENYPSDYFLSIFPMYKSKNSTTTAWLCSY
jgi:hypothetical protein